MKNIKKKFPSCRISGKYVLPLIGAALMSVSCSKDEPEPQKHDAEIYFRLETDLWETKMRTAVELNKADVNMVYLIPLGEWNLTTLQTRTIRYSLNDLISLDSSRVRGRGNFDFPVGAIQPEDSLWYVSKGWTVNQGPLYKKSATTR